MTNGIPWIKYKLREKIHRNKRSCNFYIPMAKAAITMSMIASFSKSWDGAKRHFNMSVHFPSMKQHLLSAKQLSSVANVSGSQRLLTETTKKMRTMAPATIFIEFILDLPQSNSDSRKLNLFQALNFLLYNKKTYRNRCVFFFYYYLTSIFAVWVRRVVM
jgi:hypothetical protein